MSQSAFIKLVEGSEATSLTLDEVKELFQTYQEQTSKTGSQLGWEYADAAFPYTIETKPEGEGKWFYLKGKNDLYKYIVVGVGSELIESEESEKAANSEAQAEVEAEAASDTEAGAEVASSDQSVAEQAPAEPARRHYIQLVLPDGSTHGDKAKGNEFGKHFAKKLKAELQLFNGRTMYYNPRK